MNLEIINNPYGIAIYGYSGTAENRDYAETAFRLMGRMWQTVRSNNLKNKGINIWVYEAGHKVFAGVELDETASQDSGLELKTVTLSKYAYYKHIGPYHLIKSSTQKMKDELRSKGYEAVLPHIEIYGHWTNDETKLETDLLMSIK